MAAIITDKSDGQWVDPKRTVYGGVFTSTSTTQGDGTEKSRLGMNLTILTVNAIADGESITTGIEGIHAVAWQANDLDAMHTVPYLLTQAGGVIEFSVGGGTDEGWVWILHES